MSTEKKLDRKKKRIFTIILILLPFLILLLFELLLVLLNYGGNQRLFVSGTDEGISHYYMTNRDVANRYFYMQDTKPTPPKDLFLKEKPENGYRIFVLGGSTTAGFPYANNLMFSRIMHKQLEEFFPDKHIEVVNTAMSAVNSYTLVDFMDEIVKQQPDALLIYAGHNEFYGALGVGSTESWGKKASHVRTYIKLRKFKTFLLVRDIVGNIRSRIMEKSTGGTMVDPSNTLMARIVAEQTIPYQSELYESGKSQFSDNLHVIFEKAQKKNIPVIISELVSNIADQKPFISTKADTFPPADKAYAIGKKLEAQGDFAEAKQALTLAKDLDALRFRATEEFNDMIHEIAAQYNAPVVPMKSVFEQRSENGLPGNELFLEHLHPNYDGYFLMANAFLNTMKANQFISSDWPNNFTPITDLQADWGYSELDLANADISIHYLKGGWPFKPKGLPNHSLDNYTASTLAESLAVKVLVQDGYGIEVGHYDLAQHYMQKQEWEKAFKEWKSLYYIIPFELEFYEKAAECQMSMKNFEKAKEILDIAVRYGTTPFIDQWYGQLLVSFGEPEKALPFLLKANAVKPGDYNILTAMLHSYNAAGEKEKAQAIYNQIKELEEKNRPELNPQSKSDQQVIMYNALLGQAKKFIQDKKYPEAYAILQRCDSMQETAFTKHWLGLLSLMRGDLENGIVYLEKARQLTPSDFETLYNLCNAYIKTGQKEKAQEILQRMEKIRPNFNDPQNLREQYAAL